MMKIESFQYIQNQGWSIPTFPALDSENTLILVFASPIFRANSKPIEELAQAYKKSKIIGCSTAGEIFGPNIFDNSISVAVVQFESTKLQLAKQRLKARKNLMRQEFIYQNHCIKSKIPKAYLFCPMA